MNQSGEAAEQIVRMSLEGFEVAAKVSGSGAKDIAVLLYTIMKDKEQTAGKTKLSNMLKSGKPLNVFSVRRDDLKKFQEEAKRYGILYCALVDKKDKAVDGVVDIVVRKEDAGRINRIVERFKLASYNRAEIISDIEKNRDERSKGLQSKTKEEIKLDSKQNKKVKKEEKNLNPLLAKTEKSPLSEHILETQENSTREGAMVIEKKPSVINKLNEYKKIVNDRLKNQKSKTRSTPSKPKMKNNFKTNKSKEKSL